MVTWFPRPESTCCAVVLGSDSDYIGFEPQLNLHKGDHFCDKPVDHRVPSNRFNTKIILNLCTEHFTYLITYRLKHTHRENPS